MHVVEANQAIPAFTQTFIVQGSSAVIPDKRSAFFLSFFDVPWYKTARVLQKKLLHQQIVWIGAAHDGVIAQTALYRANRTRNRSQTWSKGCTTAMWRDRDFRENDNMASFLRSGHI